jgi:hypothetical protein
VKKRERVQVEYGRAAKSERTCSVIMRIDYYKEERTSYNTSLALTLYIPHAAQVIIIGCPIK